MHTHFTAGTVDGIHILIEDEIGHITQDEDKHDCLHKNQNGDLLESVTTTMIWI